jgi:hypothetical protein
VLLGQGLVVHQLLLLVVLVLLNLLDLLLFIKVLY